MQSHNRTLSRSTLRRIDGHIHALDSAGKKAAWRAKRILIRYYGVKALESLITASSHTSAQVRSYVVAVLAQTHDSDAYQTILQLSQDTDERVAYNAAIALGTLGDARALEPLVALLCRMESKHHVECAAAIGLGQFGKKAVSSLLPLLDHPNTKVRLLAISVLGKIHDESTQEILAHLLKDQNEEIRMAGILALSQFGNAHSLTLIQQCIADPVERVRQYATMWYAMLAKKSA